MAANIAGSDTEIAAIIQTPREHSPAPAHSKPNASDLIRVLRRALLIASQNFKDPKVSVMVIVTALVSLLILLPTARALGRRASAHVTEITPTAGRATQEIKRA
jgi:hypothetical protein